MFVALDLETTGLQPSARMIEIAAVHFSRTGEPIARFGSLCNPGCRVPRLISRLTGITPAMVAAAPDVEHVLRAFLAWLPKTATLVAHNAPFDRRMLEGECGRIAVEPLTSREWLDTLPLARRHLPLADYRLPAIARSFGWDQELPMHRAAADAELVRRLFVLLTSPRLLREVAGTAETPPCCSRNQATRIDEGGKAPLGLGG